jgi:membrane associated rhomboid family serine protease
MIPIRDRLPTARTPVVTWLLIALNVLAFGYERLAQQSGYLAFVSDWGFVPGRFLSDPVNDAITIATSMFLHGGLLHLGGNMLYLWIFGDNVEDRLGRLRFLGFYFGGGLVAALAQMLVDPSSMVPMVGASGAVAAVLGAYIYLYPRAPITTVVPIFVFLQIVELPAFVVIGLWFVLQLVEGMLSLASPAHAGVAFFAHIGGFVAGLVAMMLVGRRSTPKRPVVDPWAGWQPPRAAPRSWNLGVIRARNRANVPCPSAVQHAHEAGRARRSPRRRQGLRLLLRPDHVRHLARGPRPHVHHARSARPPPARERRHRPLRPQHHRRRRQDPEARPRAR